MRTIIAMAVLCLFSLLAVPTHAQEAQQPEAIAERMSFKLVRGVTNFATAFIEIPKQTYLTVRDRGGVGYVVGPIKGTGMALYRGFVGVVEAVFFVVPQPGYYDPMIDPEYVWKGWEAKRMDPRDADEPEETAKKGE